MVQTLALGGVRHRAVSLETRADIVKQRLLLGIVACAEMRRALKHQMLEIVGETRRLRWVVTAAGTNGDVGLDARLILVNRQIDLHAIIQSVKARMHHVAINTLVRVILGRYCRHGRKQDGKKQKKLSSHDLVL